MVRCLWNTVLLCPYIVPKELDENLAKLHFPALRTAFPPFPWSAKVDRQCGDDPPVELSTLSPHPLDHSCGRVAQRSLERRRVQQRCPRAPTPEPGKGRRPKNRHSSKAKRVSARGFCLLPVLACLCRGFPGSGSLVLRPCPFGFLFVLFRLMFLSIGRGRHVPAPGGRDVGSNARAPTREPVQGTDPRNGSHLLEVSPCLSLAVSPLLGSLPSCSWRL